MAKRKQTVSKHDLIRAIRVLSGRVNYIDNMMMSLSEMFKGYVDFMDNEDEYMKFMEERNIEEKGEK
jgi:hypothetical protein